MIRDRDGQRRTGGARGGTGIPRRVTCLLPVPLPGSGAVRVHPAPEALPQLRHEGPGRNRFDDPHGSFLMRYTAENLRGCLVETMARFRPNPAADALLAAVEFVDADADPAMPTVQAVADWLAELPVSDRRTARQSARSSRTSSRQTSHAHLRPCPYARPAELGLVDVEGENVDTDRLV